MEAQLTSLFARMLHDVQAIDDPRAANARHLLTDILILALLAVLAGMDDYPGIVEYASDEQVWLKTLLPLPHGIPSVSTFRRVFAALQPAVLAKVMQGWSGELSGSLVGKHLALDGKTLRRSFEHAWDKSGLHLVTAWCVDDKLVLAQQAVDQKSNEITAVPKVLELLDLKGTVVTADALITQTAIAAQIIKGGGDYLLAVKDNHPTLAAALRRNLDEMILAKFTGVEHVYHESTEAGHGRIDTRKVWATSQIDWLQRRQEWAKLTSVAVVEATRRHVGTGAVETHRRYYIASLPSTSGEQFAQLIRNHWSIENDQHWILDIAFNEDQNRVRKNHGDQNLAVLRRMALGLLRRESSVKLGVKNKRLKAGRNRDYLLKVLLAPAKPK